MTHRDLQLTIVTSLQQIGEPVSIQDLAAEIAAYDSRMQAAMLASVEALARHSCIIVDGDQVSLTSQAEAYLSQPRPLSLRLATDVSASLIRDLDSLPTVQRLEIAGSVRRHKGMVHDIELVALVESQQQNLFGGKDRSAPAMDLTCALRERADTVLKTGPSMTSVIISEPETGHIQVNLFQTADPACWGMLYFIRTGSADFVRRALGYWKTVSAGGECSDLRLRTAGGKALDTPEEKDVFRVLSDHATAARMKPVPYIPPEKRIAR